MQYQYKNNNELVHNTKNTSEQTYSEFVEPQHVHNTNMSQCTPKKIRSLFKMGRNSKYSQLNAGGAIQKRR
jgi:hypothetical protein